MFILGGGSGGKYGDCGFNLYRWTEPQKYESGDGKHEKYTDGLLMSLYVELHKHMGNISVHIEYLNNTYILCRFYEAIYTANIGTNRHVS